MILSLLPELEPVCGILHRQVCGSHGGLLMWSGDLHSAFQNKTHTYFNQTFVCDEKQKEMIQIRALNKDPRVINASGLSTNKHRYTEASSAGRARFSVPCKGVFCRGLGEQAPPSLHTLI